MNKNFILLASLVLFSAGAASANTETQIPVLPTHVVTVSRYTDAELVSIHDALVAAVRAP